jgi:transcriptional regulator with XRE-family HTH domain
MPKGVPYRVQVAGKGTRPCTFTELAAGAGLSLALVSKIFNRKLPITPYAAGRLASFLGISIEELFTPGTVTVETPRPLGRIVGRMPRHSCY